MANLAYCPTCRNEWMVSSALPKTHAVTHILPAEPDDEAKHVHPVTRTPLYPVQFISSSQQERSA